MQKKIMIPALILVLLLGIGGVWFYMNSTPVQLKKALNKGQQYLAAQDYSQAETAFHYALTLDPTYAPAYLSFADLEYQKALQQSSVTEKLDALWSAYLVLADGKSRISNPGSLDEKQAQIKSEFDFTLEQYANTLVEQEDLSGLEALNAAYGSNTGYHLASVIETLRTELRDRKLSQMQPEFTEHLAALQDLVGSASFFGAVSCNLTYAQMAEYYDPHLEVLENCLKDPDFTAFEPTQTLTDGINIMSLAYINENKPQELLALRALAYNVLGDPAYQTEEHTLDNVVYNGCGQVLSSPDSCEENEYDGCRLIRHSLKLGLEEAATIEYNETYEYDDDGRILKKNMTIVNGVTTRQAETTFEYERNIIRQWDSDEFRPEPYMSAKYVYDDCGRLMFLHRYYPEGTVSQTWSNVEGMSSGGRG